MGRFLTRTVATALAVLIAAYLLKGVSVDSTLTALVVAAVLGLLNTFIKPVLILLTIPLTVFTLGIFLLFINVWMIRWAAELVPGFKVEGWWTALFFSFIVSFATSVIESIIGVPKQEKQ